MKDYITLAVAVMQFTVAVIRAWLASKDKKTIVQDQAELAKTLKTAMVKVKESQGDTSAVEALINEIW